MKRRHFLLLATAAALAAGPALALDIVADITAQLRAQGYTSIAVTRTLLGRQRIVARSSEYQREIIVNPRTGEILRDYWSLVSGAQPTADEDMSIIRGGPDASDDDKDDDDKSDDDKADDDKSDDDREEEDRSGSSDNSGPSGGDDD